MKTTRKIPTRFEPDIRFELNPAASAPFRLAQETRFESLRNRLIEARLEENFDPACNSHVRRAANEAAALAWITPYPLLVFPALFDEKATAALTQAERQDNIRQRSRELLEV